MRFRTLAIAIVAAVLSSTVAASAAGFTHPASFAPLALESSPDGSAAYCTQTGGVVEHRIPVYGTNYSNPKQQLILAGSADFCEYSKGGKNGSRIHLLLTTLYATKPSLAALAYYAKVKEPSNCANGGGNPASCYCTFLGGSDQFGGTNFAGGAWVGKGIDVALEACIFPDLSSIDSWGLFYHAAGIIRGADLAKVLRYKGKK